MDAQVQRMIDNWKSCAVIVAGDVMLDQLYVGEAHRLSPEAPVPVVHVRETLETPGGAANVAVNLAALGLRTTLVGVVGADETGGKLRTLLEGKGVNVQGLIVDSSRPTTRKVRVIAQQRRQVVRLDFETREFLRPSLQKKLLAVMAHEIKLGDGIVLSDYAKGMLTPSLTTSIIRAASLANKPVFVDPKGRDFSKYQGATVLLPNEHEALSSQGHDHMSGANLTAITHVARTLIDQLHCDTVVVTRGEKGMLVFDRGRRARSIPTVAVEVADVTGAGDTAIATYAAASIAGARSMVAANLANLAAGMAVQRAGTAIITASDLLAAANSRHGDR